jgi:hypothetical protein
MYSFAVYHYFYNNQSAPFKNNEKQKPNLARTSVLLKIDIYVIIALQSIIKVGEKWLRL